MLNLQVTYKIDGSVTDLNLATLKKDGIDGLILDLDNTLMLPRSAGLDGRVLAWLNEAKELNIDCVVVSNNKNKKYIAEVEKILLKLNIQTFGAAKKPRRKTLKLALQLLDLPLDKVCMVGDRVLTDVWGGLRVGVKTALVRPLIGERENVAYKILRGLEYLFLNPESRY